MRMTQKKLMIAAIENQIASPPRDGGSQ